MSPPFKLLLLPLIFLLGTNNSVLSAKIQESLTPGFSKSKSFQNTIIEKAEFFAVSKLQAQNVFSPLFQDDSSELKQEFYDFLFESISENCADQFTQYLEGIGDIAKENKLPETWILQMLDAWGKIPAGILSGHTLSLGDFFECIQINARESDEYNAKVRGKYCLTSLTPGPAFPDLGSTEEDTVANLLETKSKKAASLEELLKHILNYEWPQIAPVLGTCFPATCSDADIGQILTAFHANYTMGLITQGVVSCKVEDKPPLGAGQYAMIIVLALIALACVCGTGLDVYGTKAMKEGEGMKIILAFSFYTNTQKWLSLKVPPDNLGCFHGLRFLSMSWIVLCHWAIAYSLFVWNYWDLKTIYKDWTVYPLLNGWVAVDTFFVLSGVLVCYNLMRELDKEQGRFNYLLFVVHRYLRITPTVMISIGVWATLAPYVGNGPFWDYVDFEAEQCRRYWWENMLYINNIVGFGSGKCYIITWYLATEMQFFIVSPLVIYPLWKWRKVGFGIIAILGVAAIALPTTLKAYYEIPPTNVMHAGVTKEQGYMADIYAKPWARFGPYLVGIVTGYLLYLRKLRPGVFEKLPLYIPMLGWTLCTCFALAIVYGPMYYYDPVNTKETLTSVHSAIYGGFHRTIWGICIAWIIFACVTGYGGWANKILSMKLFIPLGRLSFCMYLMQLLVMDTYYVMDPHPKHFSKYQMVVQYFGILTMTGALSYIASMALESPFMQLEKMLFASTKKPKKPNAS